MRVIIFSGFNICAANYREAIEFPQGVFPGQADELELPELEERLKKLAHNSKSANIALDMKAVEVVVGHLSNKFGEMVKQVEFEQVFQKYAEKWVGNCFYAKKRRERKEKRGIVQMTLADVHLMVAALKRFAPFQFSFKFSHRFIYIYRSSRRMADIKRSLANLKDLISSDLNDVRRLEAAGLHRQLLNASGVCHHVVG